MICPDMYHYVFCFWFFITDFKAFHLTAIFFHLCFTLGEVSGFMFVLLNYLVSNYQFSDTITKNYQFKTLLHQISFVAVFCFLLPNFCVYRFSFTVKLLHKIMAVLLVVFYISFHPFLEFFITHSLIVSDLLTVLYNNLNFSHFLLMYFLNVFNLIWKKKFF